ncbi:methionine-rich copper-binding protein CopC, partial [Sphingorhabdus rigui]
MATYTQYNPNSIISRAMFNFDVGGLLNFRLQGLVRVSVSDGFGFEINWSGQQIQNIQNIFSQISQFANISFTSLVDYDSTPTSSFAWPSDVGFYNASDINIYYYYYSNNNILGESGLATNTLNYVGSEGDIRINPIAPRFEGDLSFSDETKVKQVLLHEILHSLGLSHPHYPTPDTVTSDFSALVNVGFQKLGFRLNSPSDLNKEHFTIMSYDEQSTVSFQNAFTPMILDVIALQQAYGEGAGTHGAGDDVILAGTIGYRTYFDLGGNDTVDASLYNSGVYVNLGQSISSANHLVGVVMSVNDATTTILNDGSPDSLRWLYGEFENAIGSNAGDFIVGNDLSNYFYCALGNDYIFGGGGTDTAVFNASYSSCTISFNSASNDFTVIGPDGTDTLTDVEQFLFSDVMVLASQFFDVTAPTVLNFSPTDGVTGIAVGSNIVVTFSEAIARGTGTITLRSGSATGTAIESFDAATSSRLSLSGSTLTINPASDLATNTQYFLVFSSGNIKDAAGNIYTGTSTYDFTTIAARTNTAPVVVNGIADQASIEDTAWSYQVPAGTFSDVDGDTLTYSTTLGDGTSLPSWLSFNAGTRTFSGTPPLNFAGTLNLKVAASDGSANVSDTFVLSVTAVEDEATGSASVTGTAAEGGTVTASVSATDVDGSITGTTYQWQVSSNETTGWTDLSGATTASYAIASDQSQVGKYLRVIATTTDALGGTTTLTSAATEAIANVNDAPTGIFDIHVQKNITVSRTDNEFKVNISKFSVISPKISALVDGGWIISWTSYGQDGSEEGVYAQRYSSIGEKIGDEFKVNAYTNFRQQDATVAGLLDGGWIISWVSIGQDGDDYGIYAQRFDMYGGMVGEEFRVNTYTASMQDRPSVVALLDGGWLISWDSNGQDGSAYGVYGQRFDSFGARVDSEFRINSYTNSFQYDPSVAALSDGGWIVIWNSLGQDGSGWGIYGQKYKSSGIVEGPEFRVNSFTSGDQIQPSVAALSDGGWVVSWSSNNNQGLGNIYGQKYDSSGVKSGPEFQINSYVGNTQGNSSIIALTDGGWVVTWLSPSLDGSWRGVYSQRFDKLGVAVGGETKINTSTVYQFSIPSAAALSDGGWVVSWSFDGVYGHRYAADGSSTHTYTLLSFAAASYSDFSEDKVIYADAGLITDADGLGTVGWQWQRSGDGGATWSDISGATSSSYTLGDGDAGKLVRTKGTYTDGQGTVETVYSAASTPVINVNDAPVGFGVSISGSAAEDANLTATASVTSDADGLPNPLSFTYQWQSSSNGSTWSNIAGATSASFTPGDAEVAKQLRVITTYTDGQGTVETATSAATAAIANVNDAPVVVNAIADQTSAENAGWSYQVVSGAFSDADGGALTYSATLGDGTSLPSWLSFNAGTRTFSGTPPQDFAGTLNLKVTASDGSANVSDTFILTVAALDVVTGASGNDTLIGASRRVSKFTGGAGND